MEQTDTNLRVQFFDFLFGEAKGYVCIATGHKDDPRRTFRQHFFHWPTQKEEINDFCEISYRDKNIWFCINLLEKAERRKEYATATDLVWSDLDACKPDIVDPRPTVVVTSSPGRYQGFWKLQQVINPEIAEEYSRRIAYKYNKNGADPSGWDLTQLFRVPFTINYKYNEHPPVGLDPRVGEPLPLEVFEEIQAAPPRVDEKLSPDVPDLEDLPNVDKVLYKYQSYLQPSFFELIEVEPDAGADWSSRMWKLINDGLEAGMEKEEIFAIAIKAKCNKYERDRRPLRFLWHEIQKAAKVHVKIGEIVGNWEPLLMPELVDPHQTTETFIDEYTKWATKATDAVPIYHELGAAMLLSATLAAHIKIETSYGPWAPNLWGLILGESTLTRKSTAMGMVMSILHEIDPDAILATDGSTEGILSSMATRSSRTSLYYRDEVAGFFESVNRKDYLAGIPETFTLLYDGSIVKRTLRKEEILVQNPIFLFFGGGIKDKTYSLINDSFILSGFLPRFLVVGGENDLSRLRRTGPASNEGTAERQKIVNKLADLKDAYTESSTMRVAGQVIDLSNTSKRPTKNAILTPDAWDFYGDLEMKMVEAAASSYYAPLALPTFERLSRSMLKLASLLAAANIEPDGGSFPVGKQDIYNAANFIQRWGVYSVDLIMNAGRTQMLRTVEKIRGQIEQRPGIMRSELMRANHLSSREMNDIMSTLIDRGEISYKKKGRVEQFWVVY